MTDFMGRIAARALGVAPVLQPRIRSRFEPETAALVATGQAVSEPAAEAAPIGRAPPAPWNTAPRDIAMPEPEAREVSPAQTPRRAASPVPDAATDPAATPLRAVAPSPAQAPAYTAPHAPAEDAAHSEHARPFIPQRPPAAPAADWRGLPPASPLMPLPRAPEEKAGAETWAEAPPEARPGAPVPGTRQTDTLPSRFSFEPHGIALPGIAEEQPGPVEGDGQDAPLAREPHRVSQALVARAPAPAPASRLPPSLPATARPAAQSAEAPNIVIEIGSIELRTPPAEPAAPAAAPAPRRAAALSLDAYLARRGTG